MPNRSAHELQYDVFLSYSSSNAEWIQSLHDDLKKYFKFRFARPLEIFLDKERIEAGDRWNEKIRESVERSAVFMPVLSPGFIKSDFCREELRAFLEAHGGYSSSAHQGRIASVELFLKASELPGLEEFQAIRFFRDSGSIRIEFEPGTELYKDALRRLANGLNSILESSGETAPPVGPLLANRQPVSRTSEPSAEIRFTADCVLDEKSVRAVSELHGGLPAIRFHRTVMAEIERLQDWWENFDSKSKSFPWGADNPEIRQSSLTWTKARLKGHWERIQNQRSGAPAELGRALELTEGAPPELREAAVAQLARFIVLQVIRFIQMTDSYLPDEGPVAHTSFPTLSRVPGWLVDLVPHRSAIGALVFGEEQFLLARVGETETDYETVVVPRYVGQHLHRSQSRRDQDTYYKWVLPQWIHYSFQRKLPPRNDWRIWVLKDDLNRECYLSSSPRPWEE